MKVIEQTRPETTALPGLAHATLAGGDDGLTQLSVWRQVLQPGAASPPHRHDCDEVVLCVAGCGEVVVDGQARRLFPDSTVVLPRGIEHQIFNPGPQALELICVFGSSPVGTFAPDGESIHLPWRT